MYDESRQPEAEQHRGDQSPGPSAPECPQPDRAGAVLLEQQQRGDEEAGQREEHRDAELAARHPGHICVEEEDSGDREPAQPVQRGDVRQPGALCRFLTHRISSSRVWRRG